MFGDSRRFTFDYAFGPSSEQSQIYEKCIRPLLNSCFSGYNATGINHLFI